MKEVSHTVLIERYRSTANHPWTYAQLDQHQRVLAEKIQAGAPGVLILSECSPVITLGRRATTQSLFYSEDQFFQRGITLYPTDRGGLETYHGPGQWVLFPIEKLDRLTGDPRGVKSVVEQLLGIACEVGKKYRPEARIESGPKLGVWSEFGKFASVGVHVFNGVLLHGLSVNGYRTPTSFLGLNPCGLDAPVDFLLEREEDPQKAFEALGDELQQATLKSLWNLNEKVDDSKESSY